MATKRAKKPAAKEPVQFVEALVPIDSLKPDPEARVHPPEQLEALRVSLREFGQVTPLTVDAEGIIRKGNGTWLAMKQEGFTQAKILRATFKGNRARAYALADNRTAELSEWDPGTVDRQLEELKGDYDLDSLRFRENAAPKAYERDTAPAPAVDGMPLDTGEARATVTAVFAVDVAATIERAIDATGHDHRGAALAEICEFYLKARRP